MSESIKTVPPDQCFWLGDKSISSIEELLSAIKNMQEAEFSHYASADHNYFANWINDVLKEAELAASLRAAPSMNAAIDVLEKKVSIKPHETHKHEAKEEPHRKPEPSPIEHKEPEGTDHEHIMKKIQEIKEEINKTQNEVKAEEAKHANAPEKKGPEAHHHHPQYVLNIVREFWYGLVLGLIIGLMLAQLLR